MTETPPLITDTTETVLTFKRCRFEYSDPLAHKAQAAKALRAAAQKSAEIARLLIAGQSRKTSKEPNEFDR